MGFGRPRLGRVVGGDGEDSGVDGEIGPRPAGARQPGLDLRQGHFAQVAGGVQGVDVDAVTVGAGQPQHLLVDGGDVDGRRGIVDGAGVEEGGHQHQLEELPGVVERRARLPGVPEGADGFNRLAHLGHRLLPLDAEAQHVVGLHLGAEAEDEAAARIALQVPGGVGQDGRAAREGNGDGRAQRHLPAVLGGQGQVEEGVAVGLGHPEAVEAQRLGRGGVGGHLRQPGL